MTIRTYFTHEPLMENVWEVAQEASYSDTIIDRMYLTNIHDLSVHYKPTGIKKDCGSYFFFEVRDVTFYADSLVTGSGWFQYDSTVTLGGQ
ncbi:MAG TPA: hypothetical protein VK826_13375 [Bacteroidia bacterium]|nr:hypothetical protein [Bacteroidia bacterium]